MKKLLGDHSIKLHFFEGLDGIIDSLKTSTAKSLNQKIDLVNQALLELIQKKPEPCFLFAAVLQFIEKIAEAHILESYNFNSFEIWLNQSSGLGFEENYLVRAKIAGKRVERSDYQTLFPIGMGKIYEGTHFVTAHKSPDLDTTVASFWGWMDAFAARVSDGLHVWNLPEGPPPSQIEVEWIFRNFFGEAVFTHLPKMRSVLNVLGKHLMTQKGVQTKTKNDSIAEIDHDQNLSAVVVIDEAGAFLGDWRAADGEGVRQVITSLSNCLRWFENHFNLNLVSVFAKQKLHFKDVESSLKNLLALKVETCEPALEFSPKQKGYVDLFLKKVLGIKHGLASNFEDLAAALSQLGGVPFAGLDWLLSKMRQAELFDSQGHLIDKRTRIFAFLEIVIQSLHHAIVQIRTRIEKLDLALKTKFEVFGKHLNTVTSRSEVEEIRAKMGLYPYLTVVQSDQDRLYPVGVVLASELRKSILGTVSLRDFCNQDEIGIPSYLNVISVIDHHKSNLNTFVPPMVILSDVQSSNTLVAQKAFEINDMNRKMPHFIHPQREYTEYLHFLYGIIDDTDLLSKVSALDVQCVAELLNRLKALVSGEKAKIIHLEDLARDRYFPRKGAERILQNEEMYSLYKKVYEYREKEVEKNIALCAKGEASNLFADTKEQNGCCRIGQTKIFAANLYSFEKHKSVIQQVWFQKAMQVQKEKPEIDLHIHMISTIVSAEEVYRGSVGQYQHQDELWLWIPNTEIAFERLKRFLSAFQSSTAFQNNLPVIDFLGENGDELSVIFNESFLSVPHKNFKTKLPIAVLRYKAGSLNSRKAMVSPFLPRLGSM